ncbi:MAG: CPBP family intramembrane metalloprotease [Anaerolineales bacterium]|nr:CPBP family intramembrane metalloprotease [Anaerolineales bacterium]
MKVHAESLLQVGVILGIGLIGTSLLWELVIQQHSPQWFDAPVLFDTLLGLGIGWLSGWAVWVLGARLPATLEIRARLLATFDFAHFKRWHVVALALVAAVPEEIFFRGTLQPEIGIILTALIFGALHSLTLTYFIYATVAGLGLGLMADWHGTLWMPIAAHFAVDYVSLMALVTWAGQQEPPLDELNHPTFSAETYP